MNGAWGGGAGCEYGGEDGRRCGHWGSHLNSGESGCRSSCRGEQPEGGGRPGRACGRPTVLHQGG